jgi:hypothetical protein
MLNVDDDEMAGMNKLSDRDHLAEANRLRTKRCMMNECNGQNKYGSEMHTKVLYIGTTNDL